MSPVVGKRVVPVIRDDSRGVDFHFVNYGATEIFDEDAVIVRTPIPQSDGDARNIPIPVDYLLSRRRVALVKFWEAIDGQCAGEFVDITLPERMERRMSRPRMGKVVYDGARIFAPLPPKTIQGYIVKMDPASRVENPLDYCDRLIHEYDVAAFRAYARLIDKQCAGDA